MDQNELIELVNENYTLAIALLGEARKNEKIAQETLEIKGELVKVRMKTLPDYGKNEYRKQQLQPFQEAVFATQKRIKECRDIVDNYRNLLEAAEISIEAYVKLSRFLKEGKN